MNSEIPDDDDYMVTLALQLLMRHESAGHEEDLVAAVMAANQVLTWHLGAPPTEAERDSFVDEFPAWRVLHDMAEGRRPIQTQELPAAPAPRLDEILAGDGIDDAALGKLCRDFLKSFQARYLPRSRRTFVRRRSATRIADPGKD